MSVNTLRESRTKAQAVFLTFTRQYKKQPSALYCFFEGEDSKYYGVRIDNIARPEESNYLICNGKEGVIGIHRMLTNRKHYSNVKAAYFIDRDFDPSIRETSLAGIYETPCYSIENFYTSVRCLSRILKSELKLDVDEDCERCTSLYTKLQQEFHDAIELLNIWIACQRDKAAELKINTLSISKFANSVRIGLDRIQIDYTVDDLYEKFPASLPISQDELDAKRNELRSRDRQKSFRGKFEIEFFVLFLNKLVDAANQGTHPYFSQKVKVSLNVSRKTVISDLSQYADTPNCLHSYLDQFRENSSGVSS